MIKTAWTQWGGSMTKDEIRFWEKVNKADSCWLWTGALDIHNCGRFLYNGRNTNAARYSYQLHAGKIPQGKHVLHKCDDRRCVNPEPRLKK